MSSLEFPYESMRRLRAAGSSTKALMTPRLQLLTLTRWHEDDLAGRVLPSEDEWTPTENPRVFCCGDWHVLRFRAIENEGTESETALWPGVDDSRFPLHRLQAIRNTMISRGRRREWSAQYQQCPAAEEGTYIKREWYSERYDPDHARSAIYPLGLPKDLHLYIGSDFAISEPREGASEPDYTEFGVFGIGPDDRVYPIDWWYKQTTSDVWIDKLIDLIEIHEPQVFFGEAGKIRRSVEAILRRRMRERRVFCRIEWLPSIKDKAARGRAFQAWSSANRVVFPMGRAWAERVVDQCVAFPATRFDDAFDTCSVMFQAIDKAHPALNETPRPQPEKRDMYTEADVIELDGWRVA